MRVGKSFPRLRGLSAQMETRSSDSTGIGADATSPFHDVGEVLDPLLLLSGQADALLVLLELVRAEVADHLVPNWDFLLALSFLLLLQLLLGD